jgi:hypothetical protein
MPQTATSTLPAPVAEATPAAQATPTAEQKTTTEAHTPTAGSVTGQTSFQNLLDWGVKAADVESVLGKTLPSNLQTLIKDWASSNGITFSDVKIKLQALVDAAK